MNLIKPVVASVLLIVLWGCPAARPTYLNQPGQLSVDGLYVHPASGMTFPTSVGDFRRNEVFRYDAEGLDVSAAYNLLAPSRQVVATFEFEENFFGDHQKLRSFLYLFPHVDGKWMVKYRFTHPAELDVAKDIETFLQRLEWTIKVS